jgi:alkylation response protein AidB-like acyl-CoA dehydrogenase
MAHRANWCILLTRTDPEAPKHRGITMLLVDMKSPGITIRPLINMANDHEFNEVFFDNVRVPRANLVGEENRGWYAAATTLDYERSNITEAIAHNQAVAELAAYAREHGAAPVARLALADRRIEAEVSRMLSYRVVSIQASGNVPNYEASVNKLFGSELRQRIMRTGIQLIGTAALITDPESRWARLSATYTRHYMRSVASTIAAGSSEIQRNVIATRGLGLPRS